MGPILVGFSGGFDSLCLLNILEELKINVIALHLNHNWRGNESLKDMEFCKRYCENKGIPFYSETLDEKVPHTETAAREARYDFFERAAKKFNSKIVFTAHNADDNAETVTKRLGEYHSQTAPLFDFYKSRNLLVEIDGTKEVDVITQEIFAILG